MMKTENIKILAACGISDLPFKGSANLSLPVEETWGGSFLKPENSPSSPLLGFEIKHEKRSQCAVALIFVE